MRPRLRGWLVEIHAEPSKRVLIQLGIGVLIVFAFAASATASVEHPPASITHIPSNFSSVALATPTPSVTPTYVRPIAAQTPRPFAVPQSVPGQPGVDQYTVALYHFDAPGPVAIDTTGNYTGTLYGNAVMGAPTLYSGVLSLDGNGSYVRTGHLGDFSQGTIEAFVDFSQACQTPDSSFTIISAGGEFGSNQPVLALREQTGLRFGLYIQGVWHWVDSGINGCRYLEDGHSANPYPWQNIPVRWPYETWRFHHVAGTWGPRGMEIWVDGVLHGVGTTDPDSNYPYKYKCNPQDQEGILQPDGSYSPNPLYPVCRTPVAAPQMSPYPPPGDYYGGLPPYSTFMIGCDSVTSCFKGRLDEVRISNIQRTFTYLVVPTITPTPTQTPNSIIGENSVDAYTSALYHLNSSMWIGAGQFTHNEATQKWDASLQYDARIASGGLYNSALFLSGTTDPNGTPSALDLNAASFGIGSIGTFDTWIYLTPPFSSNMQILSLGDVGDKVRFGFHPPSNNLAFGIYDVSRGDFIWNETNVTPSEVASSWHHVAGTWGSFGIQVWLDGKLCSTVPWTSAFAPLNFYAVGCDRAAHCFPGRIDETRFSNVQRTFTSAPPGLNLLAHLPLAPNAAPRAPAYLTYLPLVYGSNAGLICGPLK